MYSWCSSILFEQESEYSQQLSVDDLIFMETEQYLPQKKREKFEQLIIGHNVLFDRSFIADQYFENNSKIKFLDILSIAISLLSNFKDINGNSQLAKGLKSFKLVDLYEFVKKRDENELKLTIPNPDENLNKDHRNLFVTGSIKDVVDDFQNSMIYCAKDVKATQFLFRNLWSKFQHQNPSLITLGGLLEIASAIMPVNIKHWNDYIGKSDEAVNKLESKINSQIRVKVYETLKANVYKAKIKPFTLGLLDWSCYEIVEKKTKSRLKDQNLDNIEYLDKLSDAYFKKCRHSCIGLPAWFRNLCTPLSDPKEDCTEYIADLSMPKMTMYMKDILTVLCLKFNAKHSNYELAYDKNYKWGFIVPGRPRDNSSNSVEVLKEKMLTSEDNGINKRCKFQIRPSRNSSYDHIVPENERLHKFTGPLYSHINKDGYWFYKLPQQISVNGNCGNPLVAQYKENFKNNPLAQQIINFNDVCNYWLKNRDRIKEQMVVKIPKKYQNNIEVGKDDNLGAIIPRVWPIGTITRRSVEKTWLTSSNISQDRVGSELRSMIQSPKGFVFAGADVDSQEYWIASIIADRHFKSINGCTPFSYMILNGSKNLKTDLHSKVAQDFGIDRDTAKILNYARFYGSGPRFTANILKQNSQTYRDYSDQEIFNHSKEIIRKTKGNKNLLGEYAGGFESHFFNALEREVLKSSIATPFLDVSLNGVASKARDFSSRNMRSLLNWIIQSSAVDYLHTLLCMTIWVSKQYQLDPLKIVITFHDEIRVLVKESDKEKIVLCLQIANMMTRAFFSAKLGLNDLPFNVAFFSSVEIDKCIRKDPHNDSITPSNPLGHTKQYGIAPGISYDPAKLDDL